MTVRSPIERMVDAAVRCVKCGGPVGCACWTKCPRCGRMGETGEPCDYCPPWRRQRKKR